MIDLAAPIPRQGLREVGAYVEGFKMKGVGDEYPSVLPVALAHAFHHFPVVPQGTGNSHATHVAGGEDVGEGFLFIDRFAQAPGNEIGKAYPDGISPGCLRKSEGCNGGNARPRQILIAIHPPVTDDIGIHAGPAEGLSYLVDDQNIDVIDWQGGEVGAVALKEGGLLPEDLFGGQGVKFSGSIESVLQQGKAGEDFPGADHACTHFPKHVLHDGGRGGMKCLSRSDLSHADHHHLGQAALHGTRKTGVELDPVENENSGGLEAVPVHPDFSGSHFPDLDHVHAGSDFHSDGFFGQTEGFDHGALTLGGGSIVRPHTRTEKGGSSMSAEPVPRCACDGCDVVDATTSRRDGDFSPRRGYPKGVQFPVDSRLHVGEGVGDEVLVDAVDLHEYLG